MLTLQNLSRKVSFNDLSQADSYTQEMPLDKQHFLMMSKLIQVKLALLDFNQLLLIHILKNVS